MADNSAVDPILNESGKARYFYRAYGLRFRSELFCPRVPVSSENEFDADIILGEVPDSLDKPETCGFKFQAKPSQILLQTIHIADFNITDGRKIVIQPKKKTHSHAIQPLLWGWAQAALLQQREIFPLHASVLKSGNQAVLFCGPSGVGKSTISMALLKRGYRFLDDNMATIVLNNREAHVHPGIPEIKLHAKNALMEQENTPSCAPLFPGSDKFSFDGRRHFFETALPVGTIFITANSLDSRTIIALKGRDKITALQNNLFCARFIRGLHQTASMFEFLLCLGQRVPVFLIQEPYSGEFPFPLVEKLEHEKWITN